MNKSLSAVFLAITLAWSACGFAQQDIDINSADAQTLADTMTGVGIHKAQAIVAYRDQHGPFNDIGELVAVKGIGEKLVDKNRERISVHGSAQ